MTDDTKRAIEAARDIMEFLDEGLANGACSFCGGKNEEAGHDEGCHCDALRTALSALDRPAEETSNSAEEAWLCGEQDLEREAAALRHVPVERFQKWVSARPDGGVGATPAECFNAGLATGVREEQKRLRLVVTETNDALLELNHGDHEEIIACHADTLPEMYREMALAVEKAVDILQVEIHAMIDPSLSTTPGEKP